MAFKRRSLRFSSLIAIISAAALFGFANTAVGQCIQPATRQFGPYAPTIGTPKTLDNPLLEANTSQNPNLKIVTLGDSVVWGDGNVEQNKFSIKIAHDLADATGRATTVIAYAHSGARLNSHQKKHSITVPTDGAIYQMDLNSDTPTTMEQIECAAKVDGDAEIVILDGCINEVGATKIALPIPFNWTTPGHIQKQAYLACSQMKEVLDKAKLTFPKATIVVVNYYQVVTGQSTLKLNEPIHPESIHPGTTKEAAGELQAEQARLLALSAGKAGPQRYDEQVQPANQDVLYAWQTNSVDFLKTSEDCFNWSVAAADGQKVDDLKKFKHHISCPPVDKPLTAGQATQSSRVYLATVPNDPAFGYGTPQTHEWRRPSNGHPDDMFSTRVPICEAHYANDPFSLEGCKVNAIAHPNQLGAEAYHQSIWAILQAAWTTTPAH